MMKIRQNNKMRFSTSMLQTENYKIQVSTSMLRSLLVNWPRNRDLIMSVGLTERSTTSTLRFLKKHKKIAKERTGR